MKALILDVDGVLNCHSTKERFNRFVGLDPKKVDLVKKIVEKTGADVVLSTTWRLHRDHAFHLREALRPVRAVMETPSVGSRGNEIKVWLDKHPDYDRFAILDDDTSILAEHHPHWFQTDFYGEGLTDEIADKVIEHLNN